MKSNQMKTENQRIEQISPSTFVVGIDIAKENHAVQATNFRGIALTNRAVMVDNTRSGFEHLDEQSVISNRLMEWTMSSWEWRVRKLLFNIEGL